MGFGDDCCVEVAARQHGCLTRDQALCCGLSRDGIARRRSRRLWVSVLPGVYAIRGAPASPEQRHVAAALWAGTGAALSHGSAAWLWRFPDAGPGTPESLTPATREAGRTSSCTGSTSPLPT